MRSRDWTASLRRAFCIQACVVGSLLCFGLPAVADAGPRPRIEHVRLGFTADVHGVGCTSSTLSHAVPSDQVVRFEPALGAMVDDLNTVQVTDVRFVAGEAVWTLAPTQDECEFWEGTGDWNWSTGERTWAATYPSSARVIRSTRWNGVESIAGFRMNGRTRASAPTVRTARRFFGRPSERRRGDNFCRLRWRRLGLTITFANFGLGDPCRRGLTQWGRVRGGSAPWTAAIGRRPAVALGTTASYLEHLVIDGRHTGGQAWTLAEEYVPYGDGGFVPTVSALLDGRDRTVGFEFWVGAAGD
jgi:hypothetical protein